MLATGAAAPTWPFRLLGMIDSKRSPSAQFEVAVELYNSDLTPECDLDASCTLKAKRLFFGPHDMATSQDFKNALTDWVSEGRLCKMHTERQRATIKRAVPGSSPEMERVLSAGYMAQVLQSHLRAGGKDVRKTSAVDLVHAGAPLRQAERRKRQPKKVQAHILYAKHKRQEYGTLAKLYGRSIKPLELAARMKAWITEYKHLLAVEQEPSQAHNCRISSVCRMHPGELDLINLIRIDDSVILLIGSGPV